MRVGLVDIGAAGVVAALLLLPEPVRPVEATYTAETAKFLPQIAEAQAEAARRPESGEAAAQLAETLTWAGQSDWAVRAAGAAGNQKNPSPDRWRALWAISKVHAGRIEIEPAYRWAKEALAACDAPGSSCNSADRIFLDLRVSSFEACVNTGVDPKMDSKACEDAVHRVITTVKAPKPSKPNK